MGPFTADEQDALRGAFARTVPYRRLLRGWAFERYRQAFESGVFSAPEEEDLTPLGRGPYEYRADDPDPDAEIERLLDEVRAELDR